MYINMPALRVDKLAYIAKPARMIAWAPRHFMSTPAADSVPPLPHRKIIRSWLLPLRGKNTAWALGLVTADLALFALLLAATVLLPHPALQLLAGVLTGLVIGRLFILGHDACHQSLTRHRRLNRWIGRLVFLPSLTPYSLWEVGHNVVHHGHTNLKAFDFVWQPFSVKAYQALPAWRKRLERIYRSGWAPGLYYALEIWWKRMYFPSRLLMPARRALFTADCVLVSVAAAAWVAGLAYAAAATAQPPAWLLFAAFVLPLLVWNALIGFVVYVHHTHTGVAWYDGKQQWLAASPFVSTTVHLTFPAGIGTALHHIMEHTAHHVDMSVPLYRLKRAQTLLEEKLPGRIIVQPFSWAWYFQTARRCKLYDFERHCWTDFEGRRTR